MSDTQNTAAPEAAATTPVKKFSFGRPGAAPATPVEELPPGTPAAAPADNVGAQSTALAAPTNYQPPAFYTGEEDDPVDASDVRYPRLNLVQKSSAAELLAHGFGSLVLKETTKLPLPARVVVVGIRPKIWIEKTKFGGTVQPRIARSLDEVARFGGTDSWRASKENDKVDSKKPWFMAAVTFLLLIEKAPDVSDDNFPHVVGDKAYAAALLTVKSTNYNALYVPVQSEKVTGVLRKGYNTRFIELNTQAKPFAGGESAVFVPKFAEETSQEIRDLAKQLLGG